MQTCRSLGTDLPRQVRRPAAVRSMPCLGNDDQRGGGDYITALAAMVAIRALRRAMEPSSWGCTR